MTSLPGRAGASFVGFACTGLLAAGFVSGAPVWFRIILAFAGLVAAPAAMLVPALARSAGRSAGALTVLIPGAVTTVLSAHALLAGVCARLGVSFSLYATITIWSVLALSGVFLLRAFRNRALPAAGVRLGAGGVAALMVLVAASALVVPHYSGSEDAYDHMGHVRRIIAMDDMHPDGVLAMPEGDAAALAPDPRKGAFHDLVAVAADLSACDPVDVWSLLRVLMYPLAVLAFAGFAAAFVRGPVLALCMALFLVSYAGSGVHFAGTAAYGKGLAAIWYWVVAALVLRGFGRGGQGALVALLVCGGVLVHLGVAMHAAILTVSLVAFAPWLRTTRAAAVRVGAWMAAGAGIGLMLRVAGGVDAGSANEIHAHVQGIMTVTTRWFVMSPMEILRQDGLVFLGGLVLLPLTLLAARSDSGARAAVALSVIPVCIAFLPPVATLAFQHGTYMVFRSLLNAPVIPAAALTLVGIVMSGRRARLPRRIASVLLVAGWCLVFLAPSLRAFGRDVVTAREKGLHADVRARLDALVSGLPAGATILSDPVTAYRLSALSSHRFVAILEQHANPRDPYALDRLEAVRNVLSPFVLPQLAAEACRRYGVDFVVISGRPRALSSHYLTPGRPALWQEAWTRLASMPGSFSEFARGDDFVVFRFDQGASPVNDFAGVTPPVTVGPAPVTPCPVGIPRERFELTGVSITPSIATPGDSVLVTLGYRRDRDSAFGPDIVFHLRFDHESVPAQRGVPGEKHLRRLRERTSGELFRFRADLRAGHGVYEPDLWPIGVPLAEHFRVAIPAAARPGVYRVEASAVEESLLPNFDISDLLFNRDHYSGLTCATIEVGPRESTP